MRNDFNFKKHWFALIVIIGVFILSMFAANHNGIQIDQLTNHGFLFTYLSIFLGISITLLTFFASMVDKIKSRLVDNEEYKDEERKKHFKKINKTFKELKEGIIFLFISFIVVVLLTAFNNFDFPFLQNPKGFFGKESLFTATKLTIFLLSLYTLYDLLMVSIYISDATGAINE